MRDYGVLRAIRENEIELVRVWRNAPNVRANMYTQHEISEAEHLAWWSQLVARADQAYFMYELQGSPVGVVGFTAIDPVNRNASWAFYAGPDSPKGAGTKMEFLALDHAFSGLKLHKLYCEVFAFNKPVLKLHQKFGFQTEGTFREQRVVESRYVDVVRMAILEAEWSSGREAMKARIDSLLKD